jgi:hypothetical protein
MTVQDAKVTGLSWMRGVEEPIQGKATSNVIRWEEVALANPVRLATDMRILGFPAYEIQSVFELATSAKAEIDKATLKSERLRSVANKAAKRRRVGAGGALAIPLPELLIEGGYKAGARYVYNSARKSAVNRLSDWMRRRTIRVEERDNVKLQLPLFIISAAKVPGCATAFTMEHTKAQDLGWSVTILGTGLGADGTVGASASATFRAAAGQTKVVFLPITVAVERVSVLDKGKRVSQGRRIDVSGLSKQAGNPGLLLLSEDAMPPFGTRQDRYPLAGDRSGAIASFEYVYTQATNIPMKIGIKTYGVDLGLNFQARLSRNVKLTYDLCGGYDYDLYRTAEGDGVLWASSPSGLTAS